MNGLPLAYVLALASLTCPFSPTQVTAVEDTPPNFKIGDFWEYSFDASDEEIFITGVVVMEIAGLQEYLIDNVRHDTFVVTTEGEASVSGSLDGEQVSGSMTISASEKRLVSNFELVTSEVSTDMDLSWWGLDVDIDAGFEKTFTPAMNDHMAYDDLTLGATIEGSSLVTGEEWVTTSYGSDTDAIKDDMPYSHEVVQIDVPISTTAGTFSCSKVRYACMWNNRDLTGVNYYSAEVGNYVLMDSQSSYFGGLLGELTLISYSYNPDSIPPVADAGSDLTVIAGESFTLNGTASYDNVGVVLYSWEFEVDGNNETVYGSSPELTINRSGEYVFKLTVYDDAGNQDSDFVTVEVRESGILSYLTGDNLWIGLLLLAVSAGVLIAVSTLVVRRRKRSEEVASEQLKALEATQTDPQTSTMESPETPASPNSHSQPDDKS